jgi:hypothetical protein
MAVPKRESERRHGWKVQASGASDDGGDCETVVTEFQADDRATMAAENANRDCASFPATGAAGKETCVRV